MNNFFLYLLEVSLLMSLFFGIYHFILRHKSAPAFNRFYLLFSLLLAFSLPHIHIPLPFFQADDFASTSGNWMAFLPEVSIRGSTQQGYLDSLSYILSSNWLSLLYFSGGLFFLALSLYRFLQLFSILKRFDFRRSTAGNYQITNTEGVYPTFSFLHYILWDNSAKLSKEEEQQILRHEVAHVQQLHSLDILLLELLCPLLWFNPIIYAYRNALKQTHEYLADHYAVAETETGSYLKLMVKESFRQANIPLASSFYQNNHTLKRIRMLQKKPNNTQIRAFLSLSIVLTIFVAVACEDELEKITEQQSISESQQEVEIPSAHTPDMVFEVVEEPPTPVGGLEAFYKYVGSELKYPEQANSMGVEGRVFVQFVVDEQGKVSDVKAVKGIGAGCDQEAVRVIQQTQWAPGKQKGSAVKVRMIMPIMFKLN